MTSWGAFPRGTVHTPEHVPSRVHIHDRGVRVLGRAGGGSREPRLCPKLTG